MAVDENEFETVKEILFTVARLQESTERKLEQFAENHLLMQQDNQLRDHRLDQMGERLDQMGERFDRMTQQAEIDRAEFRATVQSILEALTQRFSGNGQSSG